MKNPIFRFFQHENSIYKTQIFPLMAVDNVLSTAPELLREFNTKEESDKYFDNIILRMSKN